MIHGRPWDARDPTGAPVAVLSQTAARALFGTADVVGRTIALREGITDDQPVQTRAVIGVASDTGRDLGMRPGSMLVYVPFRGDYGKRLVFLAKTHDDAGQVASSLRHLLRSIDPDLVVRSVGAGPAVVGSNAQFFEISGGIAALLGAFAWVLAIGGLYGVLSHLVLRRTREIGIRVALGAERRTIIALVLREGLAPVVLGIVAGLGIGALARAALQPQFLRLVPAIDPLVVVLVPTLFISAAVLACYIPARKAASVAPNTALRQV
jgi:putative ABC transport system permease protein